ncbi:MAG: sensor histidine kinase [Emergencia timonensis]|uniref:sensor histidine kinase n=1 Tax=Emergencia timonensis TaxID=1776384 RepID=UPI00083324B0|nr:GHKL domain-containing protein [Emergencia timonensis]WNX88915.1 GHKL domain-containing protein [Emergencia timonensis]
MNAYTTAYIINNFFYAYVLYRMFRIFYADKRTAKSIELTAYSLYAVIISITVFFNTPPLVYLLLSAGSYFFLTFLYTSTLVKRCACTMLAYIIMTCVELTVNYASGYYIHNLGTVTNYDSVVGITGITILTFFIVLLLENFVNLKNGAKIAPSYWISIILIPLGSLTLILNNLTDHTKPNQVIIDSIIILGINILWFYTYDQISRLARLEIENYMMLQQNRSYKQQLLIMKDSEEATCALRHDLKNHLAALDALADERNKEGLSQYAQSLTRQLQDNQSISNTGLLALDSLINYKLGPLSEEDIRITYQPHISSDIPIHDFDLIIILGNLIDNALEALEKVPCGQKELSLLISYDKGRLVIQLKNSYIGKLEKSLNTTKADKECHGIGLKNVRSVVRKYKGTLDISFDKGIFNVEVILYLLSQKSQK